MSTETSSAALEQAAPAPAPVVVETHESERAATPRNHTVEAASMRAPGLWRASMAIARKELSIYFATPLAWVLLAFFIFVMGYFFVVNVGRYIEFSRNAQMVAQYNPQALDQLNFTDVIFSPLIFNAALILVFVLPFLTMRLVAEERRQHSLQLLMTAPVGSTAIVFGKFLASAVLVLTAVLLTTAYPLLLNLVAEGGGVEWQTALTAYLGLFLCGISFVSIGLFLSSLAESQIVAGVSTLVTLLLLWLVGWAATAGNVDGNLKDLAEWTSVTNHLQSFVRGIIRLGDVSYFLSLTILGLFLTRTAIERTRW